MTTRRDKIEAKRKKREAASAPAPAPEVTSAPAPKPEPKPVVKNATTPVAKKAPSRKVYEDKED